MAKMYKVEVRPGCRAVKTVLLCSPKVSTPITVQIMASLINIINK